MRVFMTGALFSYRPVRPSSKSSPMGFHYPDSYSDVDAGGQRIMEFVFPGEARQQLPLILPVLAHLSHNNDERWLTCIGSEFVSKKDCQLFNINRQRLLQGLPSHRYATLE